MVESRESVIGKRQRDRRSVKERSTSRHPYAIFTGGGIRWISVLKRCVSIHGADDDDAPTPSFHLDDQRLVRRLVHDPCLGGVDEARVIRRAVT